MLESTLIGWPHLHVRLALVDDRSGPNVAGLASRRGPLLYVAAHHPGPGAARLSHAVGGGRYLIVPGGDGLPERVPGERRTERRAGGRRAVFTVAGCTGYELSGSRRVAEVA